MSDRLRVKICGVTRPEDAELAVELGADLIGVNLWPGSSRWVDAERARRIIDAVAGRATTVGIVVNQPAAEVRELLRRSGVELVQLHGDEPARLVRAFGGRAIKALRLSRPLAPADFEPYPEAWGFLLDRWHPTVYGGAGEAWEYPRLDGVAGGRPVLLAGGLSPATVRAAVEHSRPWGIDVCSGVESSPGIKDRERMIRFFDEACHAQIATPA